MEEKKYLSHFLKNQELKNNSLIIAPTGSGKTHYIFNDLLKEGRHLYLCDTENLKTSIEGEPDTFSNRKSIEGFSARNIEIMCYQEFGEKVKYNNNIINEYDTIVCDEIHNLIDYQKIRDDAALSHAIKELFKKYDNTKILYFTATPQYLDMLIEKNTDLKEILNTIDFSKNKEVKQYVEKAIYKFNNINQIKFHLKAGHRGFEYGGMKCLIFTEYIDSMKKIEKMCEEVNLNPICIWSKSNRKNKMNSEQLKVREHLIKHGELLSPYNALIINRSSETGLNITDKKMELAIINTTNFVQQVQVRGRLRHDINLLVARTKDRILPEARITLDDNYLNKYFLKEEVEEIIEEMGLMGANGNPMTVKAFRELLEDELNGYKTNSERRMVNGQRSTKYIISEEN